MSFDPVARALAARALALIAGGAAAVTPTPTVARPGGASAYINTLSNGDLRAWLRPTLAVAGSGSVVTWPDASGNGRNFGALAGSPALNGSDGVSFPAGSALSAANLPSGPTSNDEFVFVVFTVPALASGNVQLVGPDDNNAQGGRELAVKSDGSLFIYNQAQDNIGPNNGNSSTVVAGRKQLLCFRSGVVGTSMILTANGKAEDHDATGFSGNPFTGAHGTSIGPYFDATGPVTIHEAVFTSQNANRQSVLNELGARHGVTLG